MNTLGLAVMQLSTTQLLQNRSAVFRAMDFQASSEDSSRLPMDYTFEELKFFFRALYALSPASALTMHNVVGITRMAFKYDVPELLQVQLS